jgi:hypothetical protein
MLELDGPGVPNGQANLSGTEISRQALHLPECGSAGQPFPRDAAPLM